MKKQCLLIAAIAILFISLNLSGYAYLTRFFPSESVTSGHAEPEGTSSNHQSNANPSANIETKNKGENPRNGQINSNSSETDFQNAGGSSGMPAAGSIQKADGAKIAYLTFDDGPSPNTTQIIDILRRYGVHATFFLVGTSVEKYPQEARLIAENGDTLGNHSYSHNYKEIYSSPEAFINDLQHAENVIFNATGVRPKIIRFPGGSYPRANQKYLDAVQQAGYEYYDWNVDSGDSLGREVPADKIIRNTLREVSGKQHVVILFHDTKGKKTTVEALPTVISSLMAQGYQIKTLDTEPVPMHFRVRK